MPTALLDRAADRAQLLRNLDANDARKVRSFVAPRLSLTRADGGSDGPGTLQFAGYASVTGVAYDIYGGPGDGGWDETIVRGAFSKTLAAKPDVVFLLNHRGMTLARTKSGTLSLAEDDQGLDTRATLDPRQTDVADLSIAMERGDMDEMSFAFWIVREMWFDANGDEKPWWDLSAIHRQILEVDIDRGDVSLVNFGANPHTSAALRAAVTDPGLRLRSQRDLILLALGNLDHANERGPVAEIEPSAPSIDEAMRRLEIAKALIA